MYNCIVQLVYKSVTLVEYIFGLANVCVRDQINVGADHRVLDGATVAKFCNEWKLFVEKPELLMLHMR